jgi:AcrR family transcriptional regulator
MNYDPVEMKRRILEAATELFSSRGFAGTMFANVEARAGVSRGSITHHFGAKSDLAVIVYDDAAKRLLAACRVPAERVFADLASAVRALQTAYVDWIVENPVQACLLRTLEITIAESQHPAAETVRERLARLLGAWAESRIAAGAICQLTLSQLFAVILGPIVDAEPEYAGAERDVQDRWRELVFDMAMAALMPRGEHKPERPAPRKVNKQGSLFET